MNQRQILLTLAAVVVFGVAAWLLLDDENKPTAGGGHGGGTVAIESLSSTMDKFHKSVEIMRKNETIKKQYEQFAAGLDDTRAPGTDPGMAAQNQLYRVLTEKLGVRTPSISTYKSVPIKAVDDFYFININFKVGGTEKEMKRLLQDMERLGFLIQSFKMSANNHGQGDAVDMDVVVSRLVKHDAESLRKMKGASSGRGGRGVIGR